jgi:FMN phosphatase YigB (HAD superfamily)
MTQPRAVFLFDVDNTLIDNDRVIGDLQRYLIHEVGPERADQYFDIFEQLRSELGYSDYLGTLQRFRIAHPHDPHLLGVSSFLMNYRFAKRLYPGALDAVDYIASLGQTVILSDGDVVFQPRKIERAGLWHAFGGRVLIYIHKELELEDVARRYPAEHYVLIDDKIRILTAVKKTWGARLTTVFPRQGHYAYAPDVSSYPSPDISIDRIDQLGDFDLAMLLEAGHQTYSSG